MPVSLPGRPNLGQLRRQAKELRDAARRGEPGALDRVTRSYRAQPQGGVTLAAAQLVIARELGFTSWPRLKAAVESRAGTPEGLADAFVAASAGRRLGEAATILKAHPGIAAGSIYAVAVLGDARTVREMLAAGPSAATAIDEARGGRRSFTPATRDGTRSPLPGRRGWPRWSACCSTPAPARTRTTAGAARNARP